MGMIHVMVHLPKEALLAGPVNHRWMYPIERLLGELKKSVRNRAKPEGSIIEAWVQYKSLTFCGKYLKYVEMSLNCPQRNNDGGMINEKLSVFAQSARPLGDPGRGESFSENDMEVVHWFVLNNCDEIMAYLDEHEEMMKREHPSHLYAKKNHHPKAENGWKVVQKMDHRNAYAIPELDLIDNDVDKSITIDLGDLPRYDFAIGPSNDDDITIEEEEEDWETESDDSDDKEMYIFCVIQMFEYR
ncbi:hypothetical protein Prudu_884S000100 [Prunus dulcis]|uniref:DUF4218 domain-containing protein n=1 Tax=Prunus dulcis TaxID=3755 RepID=A0A5H2XQW7_PRUDU|nr:hypothetical protein Prudu_884S000100 [Prunus dulcis]